MNNTVRKENTKKYLVISVGCQYFGRFSRDSSILSTKKLEPKKRFLDGQVG